MQTVDITKYKITETPGNFKQKFTEAIVWF